MRMLDPRDRREIATILGVDAPNEMTPDEIMGLMLQIFIALLMVFIIAYFLFRTSVQMEAAEAAKIVKQYPVEQQKFKLLNSLDKVEENARTKLGLAMFSRTTPAGRLVFKLNGLLSGDRLANNPIVKNQFKQGCQYAGAHLADPEKMEKEWYSGVLKISGVKTNTAPGKPNALDKQNGVWLREEIRKRVKAVSGDTRNLQRSVLAMLQTYYIQHPERLRDPAIRGMVKRYNRLDSAGREALITELQDKLHRHARELFTKQGAPLLKDL